MFINPPEYSFNSIGGDGTEALVFTDGEYAYRNIQIDKGFSKSEVLNKYNRPFDNAMRIFDVWHNDIHTWFKCELLEWVDWQELMGYADYKTVDEIFNDYQHDYDAFRRICRKTHLITRQANDLMIDVLKGAEELLDAGHVGVFDFHLGNVMVDPKTKKYKLIDYL